MYKIAIDSNKSYRKLLRYLDKRAFTYLVEMDANRYQDGVDLRNRFGYEQRIPHDKLVFLQDDACSVLEMMLALCIRCEEHIMNEPEIGDRTAIWFADMLASMDLLELDDAHFDELKAERRVNRMLDREFEPDGHGGLFTCQNCPYDMRSLEIWYQAMWYFKEKV